MIRWLDGITDSMGMFEQAPGDGEGQGSLVCCSRWGHKELDLTERLNVMKIIELLEENLIAILVNLCRFR